MKKHSLKDRVCQCVITVSTLLLAIGHVAVNSSTIVYAQDISVTDWESFKNAIANAADGDVISVDAEFEMVESVETDKQITINGNGTIHRGEAIVGPMFKVVSGELTLGESITLLGTPIANPTKVWDNYDQAKFNRAAFVEVEEAGKLIVDGAVIKDFKSKEPTSHNGALKGVSPIYVKGGFEMKAGSIEGNEMGAVKDAGFSTWNVTNAIYTRIQNNSSFEYATGKQYRFPNSYDAFMDAAEPETLKNINAGAVFLDGTGDYTFTGGTIKNNEGHAGALVVAGGKLVMKGTASIESNWGDHFGTVFVTSDDARVDFCDGFVKNNRNINGGGFLVSKDGSLFLMGGTIDGNVNYGTGGGILIYSDNVYLLSGNITNNGSSVMGGGIYVYGDDQNVEHQFVLTLHNAEITGNSAVEDRDGTKVIGPDNYKDGDARMTDDSFRRGSGGGVWLCPAGVAEFDASLINLYGNSADIQGKDFHKDAGFEGGILIDFGPHSQLAKTKEDDSDWVHDEINHIKTGEVMTVKEATSGESGRLSVYNAKNRKNLSEDEVKLYITGNSSRKGGGLGSNGTVLTVAPGDNNDRNVDKGHLTFEKEFVEVPEEKVEYEMILADENGDPVLDEDGNEVKVGIFRLYDKEWADAYDNSKNVIKLSWPNSGSGDYSKIEIDFSPGENGVKFINVVDGQADLKVIVREYHVKNDNTRGAEISERFFSSDDPQFLSETTILRKTVKVYDPQNNNCALGTIPCDCDAGEPTTLELNYRTFNFNVNAVNKETPEIEKYVEEAVHKDIYYKDEFTYNILAYVTTNADEVVVTDELNDQLEFVSTASDVKVYDLGTEVENGQEKPVNSNHLPVYDVSGTSVDNGDVTPSVKTGTEITIKNNDYSKVEVDTNAKVLTVTLANKLEEDGSGQMVNAADDQELKDLRGHYIRIEFKAKLSEEIQQALNNGDTTISDLEYEEIKSDTEYKDGITGERGTPYTGNDPVKSKEDHTGIPNTASYTIKVIDEAKYQDTSNTVTVKPEKPEIEKYINTNVHEFVDIEEVFTYDIIAYVTKDADKVTILDELNEQLQFAKEGAEVKVYDLGTENNHKTTDKASEDGSTATVTTGEDITDKARVTTENNTLTVVLDDVITVDEEAGTITREKEDVKALRGHWIRVEFKAQLADGVDIKSLATEVIEDNEPLEVTEEQATHDGVPNKAKYTIEVGNEGKYEDESNTVTVKPEEPEIEKYVNEAVHKDIYIDEEFTYDIIAYVTKDADKVTITDTLNDQLVFVSAQEEIEVVDLGVENNHKVTNNISNEEVNKDATVASEGEVIENASVVIEGQTLTVVIEDASANRGHWVKVRFTSKIREDYSLEDLNYKEIKATKKEDRNTPNIGNDPVVSDEDHDGVINKTEYVIEVDNEAKYEDESNTVTVKPKTTKVYAEKTWLDEKGNKAAWPSDVDEVSVNVLDNEGNVVDTLVLTADNQPVASKELPMLENVTYVAEEVAIEGYKEVKEVTGAGTEEDPYVFTNRTIGGPEIEKYINKNVHEFIDLEEVFTYDIIAYVPIDADELTIVDELNEQLQFAKSGAEVKVYDLGLENNHYTNDKAGEVGAEATVNGGAEIDVATISTNNNVLTVTIANEIEKIDNVNGMITYTSEDLTPYRDHYIRVEFKAQLADGVDVSKLERVRITDNKPLEVTDAQKEHEGVANQAKYTVKVGNEGKYESETNVVTVIPETPEIEKYVNKNVHKEIELDEVFEYDIIAYVTKDAEEVTITDTLVDDLQFVSSTSDIKVVDLGEKVDHKPNGSVTTEGSEVEAVVEINDQTLTITLEEASAVATRGHWVRVTFEAKIKDGLKVEDLSYTEIKDSEEEERATPNVGNDPVITEEDHTGVPNTAEYMIKVANEYKYEDKSNTVTVKPKGETTEYTVKKTWNDLKTAYRPKSVVMHLYKDGVDTGISAELSEANNWEYTFKDLEEGNYSIVEDPIKYYFNKMYRQGEAMTIVENISRPWIPETPDEEYGHFVLTKALKGKLVETEANKEFEFRVTMTDTKGKLIYEENVKIKAGETAVYEYVPTGTKVSVNELTTGYVATYVVEETVTQECVMETGKTKLMVVTNDKPDVPDTSDRTNNMLWAMMLLSSLLIALGATAARLKASK